jgi:hypothetical protein
MGNVLGPRFFLDPSEWLQPLRPVSEYPGGVYKPGLPIQLPEINLISGNPEPSNLRVTPSHVGMRQQTK